MTFGIFPSIRQKMIWGEKGVCGRNVSERLRKNRFFFYSSSLLFPRTPDAKFSFRRRNVLSFLVVTFPLSYCSLIPICNTKGFLSRSVVYFFLKVVRGWGKPQMLFIWCFPFQFFFLFMILICILWFFNLSFLSAVARLYKIPCLFVEVNFGHKTSYFFWKFLFMIFFFYIPMQKYYMFRCWRCVLGITLMVWIEEINFYFIICFWIF